MMWVTKAKKELSDSKMICTAEKNCIQMLIICGYVTSSYCFSQFYSSLILKETTKKQLICPLSLTVQSFCFLLSFVQLFICVANDSSPVEIKVASLNSISIVPLCLFLYSVLFVPYSLALYLITNQGNNSPDQCTRVFSASTDEPVGC